MKLSVALAVPLRRSFDYQCDDQSPCVGGRVRVPFGSRKMTGLVTGLADDDGEGGRELRSVIEVVDSEPLFPKPMWELLLWSASYYHHPLGEVLWAALPARLRRGGACEHSVEPSWRLTEAGDALDDSSLARAPLQRAIVDRLRHGPADRPVLAGLGKSWRSALKRLCESGWAEEFSDLSKPKPVTTGPTLHDEQMLAVTAISATLGEFQPHLLDGVTGSGKTEVYLSLIEAVLARDERVLVLVPEIGLTPQLLDRFRKRLPAHIAVMHSGLSEKERSDAWSRARAGDVDVVVGTRSSVFAPLPNLGMIIVDEEHDLSLKQQDGFRYHARDVAVRRAQQAGCPIVLGSATPALETLSHAHADRYTHLKLTHRAGGATPPRFAVIDVRRQRLREGISQSLLDLMRDVLGRGEQVLVFVNRRGYAPVLLCGECGWHAECERCDANLTWHRKARQLRCHHCGHRRGVPTRCPSCDHDELVALGEGTERVEQLLRERFEHITVLRADRDTTRRKGSLDEMLERARSGEPCILVGTQMLAKGHDFPGVTLAVIVNVDQALFSGDFRAPERLGQLIVQVAGRAGRGELSGAVALQTLQPEHPLFAMLVDEGYSGLAEQQLAERKEALLPPSSYLTLLRAEANSAQAVYAFLEEAARSSALKSAQIDAIGPMPAPMARRAGVERGHLLLQADNRRALHTALRQWVAELERLKSARRVRWSVDVDPQEMI